MSLFLWVSEQRAVTLTEAKLIQTSRGWLQLRDFLVSHCVGLETHNAKAHIASVAPSWIGQPGVDGGALRDCAARPRGREPSKRGLRAGKPWCCGRQRSKPRYASSLFDSEALVDAAMLVAAYQRRRSFMCSCTSILCSLRRTCNP